MCPRRRRSGMGSYAWCGRRPRPNRFGLPLRLSGRLAGSIQRASVRRHPRALAIVARLLSQDHFSEKADMVARSALNSFEERAPNTGELNIRRYENSEVLSRFRAPSSPFRPSFLRLPALLRNWGRYFAAGVASVDTGGEFTLALGSRGNPFAEDPSLPRLRHAGRRREFATSVSVGLGPSRRQDPEAGGCSGRQQKGVRDSRKGSGQQKEVRNRFPPSDPSDSSLPFGSRPLGGPRRARGAPGGPQARRGARGPRRIGRGVWRGSLSSRLEGP
jgi:hypothetical protein